MKHTDVHAESTPCTMQGELAEGTGHRQEPYLIATTVSGGTVSEASSRSPRLIMRKCSLVLLLQMHKRNRKRTPQI